MLGLQVLYRASMAPLIHWRGVVIFGLPYIAFVQFYHTILGQIRPDSLAFISNLLVLLAAALALSVTVAVAWQRMLLRGDGLWASLLAQPRLAYGLWVLGLALASMLILPQVLIGLRQVPLLMTTDTTASGPVSKSLIGLILIVARDQESLAFLLIFCVFGFGLPGLAIGRSMNLRQMTLFVGMNLYPIVMACLAASGGLFLLGMLRLVGVTVGPNPPWAPWQMALDLALQTYGLFLALSVQAELFRLYQITTPQV
jgi:hypothetical protein